MFFNCRFVGCNGTSLEQMVMSRHEVKIIWNTLSINLWRFQFTKRLGLGFMLFNATFNYTSVIYRGGQFYWWRRGNRSIPGESRRLPQVTEKLYHIMLCTSNWAGFELTTSVVIGTDCVDSCKTNYHTITTTTASWKCGVPYILYQQTYIHIISGYIWSREGLYIFSTDQSTISLLNL